MYRSFRCIRIRLMPMRLTGNRCQKPVRVSDASGMHWYSLLNISLLNWSQFPATCCIFVPVYGTSFLVLVFGADYGKCVMGVSKASALHDKNNKNYVGVAQ